MPLASMPRPPAPSTAATGQPCLTARRLPPRIAQVYEGGSGAWCTGPRETRVIYTASSTRKAQFSLDFVEEPRPCSFLFHVSGPAAGPASS